MHMVLHLRRVQHLCSLQVALVVNRVDGGGPNQIVGPRLAHLKHARGVLVITFALLLQDLFIHRRLLVIDLLPGLSLFSKPFCRDRPRSRNRHLLLDNHNARSFLVNSVEMLLGKSPSGKVRVMARGAGTAAGLVRLIHLVSATISFLSEGVPGVDAAGRGDVLLGGLAMARFFAVADLSDVLVLCL